MCGIAGFTTFESTPGDPGGLIEAMTQALAHRGPDGHGHYIDSSVVLGHRRLSIIDVEGGAQPMGLAEGRYQIVYNGEIYNYVELREQLESQGHQFRTRSDTEVLLACFVAHGIEALKLIDGMFAFAIWDRQAGELFLARDRTGIKPLFYSRIGTELVFASELKALLKHPKISRRVSGLSVSKYFSRGYVPAPSTIFEDVHKLEPGFFLRWGRGGLRTEPYWDIPLQDAPASMLNIDDSAAHLLSLLRDSVKRQLRSDVPVGVFLSGGVDSSTITALASQVSPNKLQSFAIGFEQTSYDESPFARQIADLCGTEHHVQIVRLEDAIGALPGVLGMMDEPLADPSIVPTYLLCKLAARNVKVVLSGDGGDELFAGYPSFQAHKIVEALSFLPTFLRDTAGRLVRRLPVSHRYTSLQYLAQEFYKGLGMSPEIRFCLWMGCYGEDEKKSLFAPAFHESLLRTDPFEDVATHVRRSGLKGSFERLLYLCMKTYFQDQVLTKVDRASMAHSLEVRVPFMDRDVVEFSASVQSFYKLRGLTTKYLLKRAVRDLLPRKIIHRRKAGFMMPVATWLGQPSMREMIADLCSESAVAQTGFFNAAYVHQMLDEHYTQKRDHRKQIWPLLCFMAWMRHYGSG